MKPWILLLCGLLALTLNGCSAEPAVPPTLTPDPYFQAQGGGDPRGAGYWMIWNSCAPDNQAETAAANGGRAAGWAIMDDLLTEPGVLVGTLQVSTCEQGLHLLQREDLTGEERTTDPTYPLAAQLLAAQLNLAAGAEYCPAGDDAVQSGQLLLISAGFDGLGEGFETGAAQEDQELAVFLTEQLQQYNAGLLCR